MLKINQYLILNKKNYFKIADEFVTLHQLFKTDTLLEKFNFWVDLVIYPLYTLISILFFKQELGIFTMMSTHKTVSKWQQYLRYMELKCETDEWKAIVQSVGGPFISTNDDKYHVYVYADGMQRLHDNLFIKNGFFDFNKKE